jgi:hypothetical protein
MKTHDKRKRYVIKRVFFLVKFAFHIRKGWGVLIGAPVVGITYK